MPKGQYDRSKVQYGKRTMSRWHPNTAWSDEQDDFLKAKCATTLSYAQIAQVFNEAFPNAPKTRNAILGRATRKGYRASKPHLTLGRTASMTNTRAANVARAKRKHPFSEGRVDLEQKKNRVVFDKAESVLLRQEGVTERGTGRKLGAGDPVVIERKKGNLPAVVESTPLTSIPMADACELSCMWPTNIECTEVCGAKAMVGSYCARHAGAAYRIMPTVKRNRIRHKEDREHLVRIDGSHKRSELDADGLWMQQQMLNMPSPSIDDTEEGSHPLFIPHFMDKQS
jgi:hypothetical protein